MAAAWRYKSLSVSKQFKCLQYQATMNSVSTGRYLSIANPFSFLKKFYKSQEEAATVMSQDTAAIQRKVNSESVRSDGLKMMEKFIPLSRYELVKGLSKERRFFSPSEVSQMEKLSVSLDAYISRRFHVQLEEMKLLYDALDPDKVTVQLQEMTKKEVLDNEYWFLQKLEMLLYKANYYKIRKPDIAKLLQSHDVSEGIRVSVDPLNYSTLHIWTRGLSLGDINFLERMKQRAKRIFWRNREISSSFEYYTRVFIAVRSKNSNKLHLKIFKDVPCNELEYLVPDGKIEMSNLDRGLLASGVLVGTLAVCAKLFNVAATLKLDYGSLGLCVAAIIGARSWIGYKNKRNKYMVNLSRTLYFKSIANNRGVLALTRDRAEDEDFKETLLAYMFLLSPPNRRGVPGTAYSPDSPKYHSKESLKQQIEDWLFNTFRFSKVSFDVEDAIAKLDQMGLLVRNEDNTFGVVPIDVALETLPNDPAFSIALPIRDKTQLPMKQSAS